MVHKLILICSAKQNLFNIVPTYMYIELKKKHHNNINSVLNALSTQNSAFRVHI